MTYRGPLSPLEIVLDRGVRHIPSDVYSRPDLITLDYSGNEISRIDEAICQLTNLQELKLSRNRLVSVPKSLANLRHLRVLDLSSNQLTSVPAELGKLKQLEVLNLSNNRLTQIPQEFAEFAPGILLRLDNNPLGEPLSDLASRGPAELLAYLRSLRDARPNYEAKLLLVGEGNVGKTSLLAALRGEPFLVGRDTTHGIETASLSVAHPGLSGKQILLHTWDFGGQEVYRISHQFFFSRRAIFLVVWRPREGQEENAVADWCERIRLRAGNEAKILLVATHGDERRAELDWPALKEEFGSMLIERHTVDNKTRSGIRPLLGAIAQTASTLPHMGEMVSPIWLRARKRILSLSEPEISFRQFMEICREYDLDEAQGRLLAISMHDLGYIIYFSDDEGLRDVVVLQPDWLTKAIGQVLEDHHTANSGGILDHARLPALWGLSESGAGYDPRYFPYFLRLMEKFDVSYRIDDRDASLVSQLVPYERPSLPWRADTSLRRGLRELVLRVKMNKQPPGLMAWIIVRNHHYSTSCHWRNGTFLSHDRYGSEALLELKGEDLSIRVRAPSPDFFFHQVLGSVETLIRHRWPGLRYDLLVPCPNLRADCSGTFPLLTLVKLREEGESLIHCHQCAQRMDVHELLTGFKSRPTLITAVIEEVQESERRIKEEFRSDAYDLGQEVQRTQALAADAALGVRSVLRSLATEVNDCPRLFSVSDRGGKLTSLRLSRRYEITLWCEHPSLEHPCDSRRYEYVGPKDWILKVTPYLQVTSKIVKMLVPIASGAIEVLAEATSKGRLGDVLKVADPVAQASESLSSLLPARRDSEVKQSGNEPLTRSEAEGLRMFRTLLFELDHTREFAGLRRVLTPTGDYLWVCVTHYPLYDPGLPSLPTADPRIHGER